MATYLNLRWDIFCTVIDNLGDIGVSWRLARQLQQDYRQTVRLWVDDLRSLALIAPQIKPELPRQFHCGIEVCHWRQPFAISHSAYPPDVVIEMFACDLPETYVAMMALLDRSPVWINLEYLSAENWVPEYHGLSSPHPRLPLTKLFFFPGFVPGTGGLLREQNLMQLRRAFDDRAERQFWQSIGSPQRSFREYRISLFCYEHAPVEELIEIWRQSSVPIFLIIPQSVIVRRVKCLLRSNASLNNGIFKSGQLTVQIIPFLEQTRYDQLLWACDLNFVRGEDSFVRAQWAGKPFVWHIYPQSENAHWKKLDAFLNLYMQPVDEQMPAEMVYAIRKFWCGWNARDGVMDKTSWSAYIQCYETLKKQSMNWMQQLALQDDLVRNLVQVVRNQL